MKKYLMLFVIFISVEGVASTDWLEFMEYEKLRQDALKVLASDGVC